MIGLIPRRTLSNSAHSYWLAIIWRDLSNARRRFPHPNPAPAPGARASRLYQLFPPAFSRADSRHGLFRHVSLMIVRTMLTSSRRNSRSSAPSARLAASSTHLDPPTRFPPERPRVALAQRSVLDKSRRASGFRVDLAFTCHATIVVADSKWPCVIPGGRGSRRAGLHHARPETRRPRIVQRRSHQSAPLLQFKIVECTPSPRSELRCMRHAVTLRAPKTAQPTDPKLSIRKDRRP
jgi:hypothetical protein